MAFVNKSQRINCNGNLPLLLCNRALISDIRPKLFVLCALRKIEALTIHVILHQCELKLLVEFSSVHSVQLLLNRKCY